MSRSSFGGRFSTWQRTRCLTARADSAQLQCLLHGGMEIVDAEGFAQASGPERIRGVRP